MHILDNYNVNSKQTPQYNLEMVPWFMCEIKRKGDDHDKWNTVPWSMINQTQENITTLLETVFMHVLVWHS